MRRVVFNFFAKLCNVDIHGSSINRFCVFVAQDFIQQFRPGNRTIPIIPIAAYVNGKYYFGVDYDSAVDASSFVLEAGVGFAL